MTTLREKAPTWLAATFGVVGSLHFVAPKRFAATIPAALPAKNALVLASGVVEVACAAGLLAKKPWAGPLSAATLLAVWPANIQMALDAKSTGERIGMWARVPLQVPMIWAALQSGRTTAS